MCRCMIIHPFFLLLHSIVPAHHITYILSLHDALPISLDTTTLANGNYVIRVTATNSNGTEQVSQVTITVTGENKPRSEEHTSELQSPCNLVCRLLLEKKNIILTMT